MKIRITGICCFARQWLAARTVAELSVAVGIDGRPAFLTVPVLAGNCPPAAGVNVPFAMNLLSLQEP